MATTNPQQNLGQHKWQELVELPSGLNDSFRRPV
jgi:hypothetical protein